MTQDLPHFFLSFIFYSSCTFYFGKVKINYFFKEWSNERSMYDVACMVCFLPLATMGRSLSFEIFCIGLELRMCTCFREHNVLVQVL